MDETTKTTLDKYLELFEAAKERVGDQFLAMSLVQEISRDRRGEQVRAERAARSVTRLSPREAVGSQPASQKQRDWLRDLGIYIPQNCTRTRASELLTEALATQAAR